MPTPGGFALAGTLTLPHGAAGPVPVVITISASGPQTRDEPLSRGYRFFAQLADTLGRRGIGVLRLDDRGVGGSGGDFDTATSRDFADDVQAALAWLRSRAATQRDVDSGRLALLGHSEGGLVAPMVAANDSALGAVVLLAGPAYPGRRILESQLQDEIRADASRAGAQLDSMLASSPWMRFFGSYDPLPTARRVRVPVLILHGTTDKQVTPEQADTLAAAIRSGGNRAVTVRLIPATNHLFLADTSGAPSGYGRLPSKLVGPAVLGPVVEWLVTQLDAAAITPPAGSGPGRGAGRR
ncbi:MAG TPA: alpha/beta fold hydrolase [Gemmatimonadaceae bacterium]|nr:alpha/beta fold hydrolase [Gemmatimonadaceae bacterium]